MLFFIVVRDLRFAVRIKTATTNIVLSSSIIIKIPLLALTNN